jgi:hypothetical protein
VDTVNSPGGFDLTSSGEMSLATASTCVDSTCAYFSGNGYLNVPSQNFGQFSGLTIAVWIKPASTSGANAAVFNFGHVQESTITTPAGLSATVTSSYSFTLTRDQDSTRLKFTVKGPLDLEGGSSALVSGGWEAGVWKHVVWSLSSQPATPAGITLSTWNIYINGLRATTFAGSYPANLVYTMNYIGKGVAAADSYVGHMDSFYIIATATNAAQARAIYMVSFLRCPSKLDSFDDLPGRGLTCF